MSKEDIAELNEGRAIAIVHGKMNYTDVFGTKHWVKFCNYTASIPFMGSEAVQKAVGPCVEYNDTDENQ